MVLEEALYLVDVADDTLTLHHVSLKITTALFPRSCDISNAYKTNPNQVKITPKGVIFEYIFNVINFGLTVVLGMEQLIKHILSEKNPTEPGKIGETQNNGDEE